MPVLSVLKLEDLKRRFGSDSDVFLAKVVAMVFADMSLRGNPVPRDHLIFYPDLQCRWQELVDLEVVSLEQVCVEVREHPYKQVCPVDIQAKLPRYCEGLVAEGFLRQREESNNLEYFVVPKYGFIE